jgi:hypothetical protein
MLRNWSHNDSEYRISEDDQRSEIGEHLVPRVRYHVSPNENTIIFQVNLGRENNLILSLIGIRSEVTKLVKFSFVISKFDFMNLDLRPLAQGGVQDRVLKFRLIRFKYLLRIQTL